MVMKRKKEKISFWKTFQLYWQVARPYTPLFIFAAFLVTIMSITHVIEKFLFKIIIDNGETYTAGTLDASVLSKILFIVGAVYLGSVMINTFCHWLKIHIVNRLDGRLIYDLKKKFFDHIIGLSHRFHTTHKTGSMISRLMRGGRSMEGITDAIIMNSMPLVVQMVVVGAAIAYFDVFSAFVVITTSLVFLTYSLLILRAHQKPSIIANDTEDIEKGTVSDSFTNIDSIKYFGKEDLMKSRFAALAEKTRKSFVRSWDYYRYMEAGQGFILGLGVFFLVYFPLQQFLAGTMTLGTLIFLYTVYFNLAEPLYMFVWGARRMYESLADLKGLAEYDYITNEIIDAPSAPKFIVDRADIEFRNVSFTYHQRKVLNNLNLKIEPNEKVALVGHSGSGKTTIVKLLYRFYDVQKGDIFISGKNIREVKQESLRSELSIVPQECILFDDTLYNNVAFSNPNASRAEVMRAFRFAQLDRFIASLPEKEKTIVGERGVKLSGGEKQRVSIARAILANKKILVLDEATSALDSKTEHEIQNDLAELMKGRTAIIIAHRLSTIMRADKIVVMDKGSIVQVGTHRQLISRSGIYRELWSLQKGGYIEE
ncbi:MAG: ABC transporter ATP-binding protein [Nanoarchaeota archaeon]